MTTLSYREYLIHTNSTHFTCLYALDMNRITFISEYEDGVFFPLFTSGCRPLSISSTEAEKAFNDERAVMNRFACQCGLVLDSNEDIGEVCYAYQNRELRDEFKQVFNREDLLHYCYAFLYTTKSVIQVNEALSSVMIKIPYPTETATFWKLADVGRKLRNLMPIPEPYSGCITTRFPMVGDNKVKYASYQDGKVAINREQYFVDVPESSWDFDCFGYFPAQEWLKNRLGTNLNEAAILYYRVLIDALQHTIRIRNKIDQFLIDCAV